MLEGYDIKGDEALNGEIAYNKVKDRLASGAPFYKLLVLDFSMPAMDGPTACRLSLEAIDEHNTKLKAEGAPESSLIKHPYICCVTAYCE